MPASHAPDRIDPGRLKRALGPELGPPKICLCSIRPALGATLHSRQRKDERHESDDSGDSGNPTLPWLRQKRKRRMIDTVHVPQNVRKYMTGSHSACAGRTFVTTRLTARQSPNCFVRRIAVYSGVKGPAIPRTDFSNWTDCDWQYTGETSARDEGLLNSTSG